MIIIVLNCILTQNNIDIKIVFSSSTGSRASDERKTCYIFKSSLGCGIAQACVADVITPLEYIV